jgi:Uma2 family endonuclease
MGTTPAQHTVIDVDDYLAGERESEVRHEYVAGQVYPMVGASDRHALLVNALAFVLTPAAREARCQLFTSEMKVRLEIGKQDVFYYPDLLVSCVPDDRATSYREHPCLIVEVLSESTERLDRREKMLAYQTIASL